MAAVDVIMPVFRGRRWVEASTESLRAQTFRDWHLIVVDDACPESTGELVQRLIPAARLVGLGENQRAAAARNAGVEVSDAPLVALLDQDDVWHPTKLERQVAAMTGRPSAGASHTNALLLSEEGTLMGEATSNERRNRLDWDHAPIDQLLRAQFEHNRVKTASSVIRREAWDDVGGMRTTNEGGEDWALWMDLLARSWRLIHIREPLHYWRQHQSNRSSWPARAGGMEATRRRYALRYAQRLGPRRVLRAMRG